MQQSDNPYSAPEATNDQGNMTGDDIEVRVVAQLENTRLWILLLSIALLSIGALIVTNIVFLLVATGGAVHVKLVTAGFILGVFALVALIAGMILLNVRSLMLRYIETRRGFWLERAARAQCGFWQLLGYSGATVTGIILITAVYRMLT